MDDHKADPVDAGLGNAGEERLEIEDVVFAQHAHGGQLEARAYAFALGDQLADSLQCPLKHP